MLEIVIGLFAGLADALNVTRSWKWALLLTAVSSLIVVVVVALTR